MADYFAMLCCIKKAQPPLLGETQPVAREAKAVGHLCPKASRHPLTAEYINQESVSCYSSMRTSE